MNRSSICIASLIAGLAVGCSSYKTQSAPGSRFVTASDSAWSDGASQFLGASASAEVDVRDAESRGALAYAAADARRLEAASSFSERMTLSQRLAACNRILEDTEASRRQYEECRTAANQAHQRQVFERSGYPPYAGYGFGYGVFPGADDILVPGTIAGAYGAVTPGTAQPPAAAAGKLQKDMAALAKRQRDLEESAAAIAKAQAAKRPVK